MTDYAGEATVKNTGQLTVKQRSLAMRQAQNYNNHHRHRKTLSSQSQSPLHHHELKHMLLNLTE